MPENQIEQTIAVYNQIAKEYEGSSFAFDAKVDLPEFTALVPSGGRVLDAGCGYGRELAIFTAFGYETYGIDLSSGMLKLAQKRAPQAIIARMDVTSLTFDNDYFDGIWCRGVLHHLPKKWALQTLQGIHKVLKPNGVLFTHVREGQGQLIAVDDLSAGQERTFTLFAEQEMRELTEAAGFDTLKSYRYNEIERYGIGRKEANFVVVMARKTSV